jgi:ribosome biogenesis GTPase
MLQPGGQEKKSSAGGAAPAATVTAVRPKEISIRLGGVAHELPLPGRMKKGKREATTPIAVGDRIEVESRRGRLRVKKLLRRINEISRVDSLRPPRKHVLAANVDLAVAVVSAHEPPFNPRLLDRLLLLGEAAGLPGVICVNKWDLVAGSGDPDVEHYERIGYRVQRTSALTGEGLEDLTALLANRVSLLVGASGVGKSNLINRLVPGADQHTRPLSESTGRGVHTTTRVDWLDLASGGVVLDTPGLRHIRPWGLEPGNLARLFPEIRDLEGRCRFRDCMHRAEPDCGVRTGLSGDPGLSGRYDSYLRILESLEREELW